MTRLFPILYGLAATVLAGSAIVVALAIGQVDLRAIVVAAISGALVALPAAWVVARRLAGA